MRLNLHRIQLLGSNGPFPLKLISQLLDQSLIRIRRARVTDLSSGRLLSLARPVAIALLLDVLLHNHRVCLTRTVNQRQFTHLFKLLGRHKLMRVWFLRSHIYNLLDTLQIGLTVVVFPLFNHVLLRLRPTSEVDDGGGRLVDLSDLICLIVDFTYAESPHFPQKTVSFCLYLSQQFALTDITVL